MRINVGKIECKIFRALQRIIPSRYASQIADVIGNGLLRLQGRTPWKP